MPLVATPRSELLRRVLGCLGDHPHDDTIDRVTRRLGLVRADAVEAALTALDVLLAELVNAGDGRSAAAG